MTEPEHVDVLSASHMHSGDPQLDRAKLPCFLDLEEREGHGRLMVNGGLLDLMLSSCDRASEDPVCARLMKIIANRAYRKD
jgi:hypothetical protein